MNGHSRSARSWLSRGSRHGRAGPAFSLLRLSAGARLGGAAALIALLWALVAWALH